MRTLAAMDAALEIKRLSVSDPKDMADIIDRYMAKQQRTWLEMIAKYVESAVEAFRDGKRELGWQLLINALETGARAAGKREETK